MTLYLTPDFINDLRDARDLRFVRAVLSHTIGSDGEFSDDADDHRYDGITDAWIRYVSRGATAYRVIFIRRGNDVYLYRAGNHQVEDHLSSPSDLADSAGVAGAGVTQTALADSGEKSVLLLKATEATFLGRFVESFYHVRHKEIMLVSPFIDLCLLESRHPFGRFLDRAVEEGTKISLVTRPPSEDHVQVFRQLEARSIDLFFHSRLHAKVYLFDVDEASRSYHQQHVLTTAIIGSSNLTTCGICFSGNNGSEELCCSLPRHLVEDVRTFVTRLAIESDDLNKHVFKHTRSKRTA